MSKIRDGVVVDADGNFLRELDLDVLGEADFSTKAELTSGVSDADDIIAALVAFGIATDLA